MQFVTLMAIRLAMLRCYSVGHQQHIIRQRQHVLQRRSGFREQYYTARWLGDPGEHGLEGVGDAAHMNAPHADAQRSRSLGMGRRDYALWCHPGWSIHLLGVDLDDGEMAESRAEFSGCAKERNSTGA